MGFGLNGSIYWPLIHITRNYSNYSATANPCNSQFTVTHTAQCPQSIAVSTIRFLATDFNTETTSVSLNYTLQISRNYSTWKVFFSQPDFQLHWTAFNNSDASIQLLCSQAQILADWRLETQPTLSCLRFSISFDCRLKTLPQFLSQTEQRRAVPYCR
jgi:hypothetical protein